MTALRRARKKPMRGSAHRLRGCPLTRNQSNWCFGFCRPENGRGFCGRPAPHAVLGRTQLAILKHREREPVQAVD